MTKMVQLADDAYERLRREKQEGESFSETVRRLTRPKASLLDLQGIDMTDDDHARRSSFLDDVDALDRSDAGAP